MTVGTDVGADLAVEAHLISPWGTWDWIGPAAVGAVLPGSGQVRLDFEVTPPPWPNPANGGHWSGWPPPGICSTPRPCGWWSGDRRRGSRRRTPGTGGRGRRREARLRATSPTASLPLAGTSEGRQLRRWLTQLIVTERVVIAEAARLGVVAAGAPGIDEVLPGVSARLEIGSVIAAALSDPLARALFVYVTADVAVSDDDVADYHARNPMRFATGTRGHPTEPAAGAIRGRRRH